MWLLGRLLPILIGDYVEDEDEFWANFLSLLQIIHIPFSSVVSDDLSFYLQSLICDHHNEFKRIFPGANVIPKMYFMIHTPRIIRKLVIRECGRTL